MSSSLNPETSPLESNRTQAVKPRRICREAAEGFAKAPGEKSRQNTKRIRREYEGNTITTRKPPPSSWLVDPHQLGCRRLIGRSRGPPLPGPTKVALRS